MATIDTMHLACNVQGAVLCQRTDPAKTPKVSVAVHFNANIEMHWFSLPSTGLSSLQQRQQLQLDHRLKHDNVLTAAEWSRSIACTAFA